MAKQGKIQAIRGVQDLLPEQVRLWRQVEDCGREVFETFGFSEIRIPSLEPTDLFARSIGEATDIVEKEMYTFEGGSESVTLRPEGTAGVVRAWIEHNLGHAMRVGKLYYLGPMFRRERPQKGRLRQFHQIGAEVFGSSDPAAEVTLLVMLKSFFEKLGLQGTRLEINSLGGPESRSSYRQEIYNHFKPRIAEFCEDCRRRIERNPLRILDCKADADKVAEAPQILDFLTGEDEEHWKATLCGLEDAGLQFDINPRIVRGLDYYTRTVFEFTSGQLGTQNAVAAGGRYDGLVEQLGGQPTPACGFALGIERLVMLLEQAGKEVPERGPRLFIAALGEQAKKYALRAALDLARQGIRAEIDLSGGSLKAQMRYADKLKAEYVLVLGENELDQNRADLKRMADGATESVELDDLAERLA